MSLVSDAWEGFDVSRYDEAIKLLLEVIKLAPNLPDPYHTLGLLHEASNNPRKALDFYMIAVHLTPRDISLWRRLAALSTDLGFLRQAIYCLSKVRQPRTLPTAHRERRTVYIKTCKTFKWVFLACAFIVNG